MDDKSPHNKYNSDICSWCGQITQVIWVHGHGQCSSCGYNIDECCRGESCENNFPAGDNNEENN